MKVREGRPLVGGLEERENGSDYAGSDPAPRLRLGSLLGAVSEWVRKTDLVVRGVEIQQGDLELRAGSSSPTSPSPSSGTPTPCAEHLAV